jgi:hypothetical protein
MTTISQAEIFELPEIMKFIDSEWRTGHVLSQSREMFLWQYGMRNSEKLNFLLARNRTKIVGILGFTVNSQYCAKDISDDVKWLSMWKVTSEAEKGTGLRLLNIAESVLPTFGVGTVGCNESALQIYESLGFQIGELKHYYHPNIDYNFSDSSIYNFVKSELPELTQENPVFFIEAAKEKFSLEENLRRHISNKAHKIKAKTPEFYINRYLNHPFYNYQLKIIADEEKNELGFLIFRIASTPRGKVLRILEIITTVSNINLALAIQKLLDEFDCQYADYFTNIVKSEIADEYGLLTVDSSMNLPNLFEPLSEIKSRIYFAIKLKKNDAIQISRGDCDQDRPNILG